MLEYEVVVVGGGLSGVAAAVKAARDGAKTLLIERGGSLGGAATNMLVYPFMKCYIDKGGVREYIAKGIFSEIRKTAESLEGINYAERDTADPFFSPEYLKLALDKLALDSGVSVLFHSVLTGVKRVDRKIEEIIVQSGAQSLTVKGSFFIDATGDGDLLALAGCGFTLGRNSDGLCQPMTTCFRVCGVDIEQFMRDYDGLQNLYKQKRAAGEIKNPRENILAFLHIGDGVVHFNTTRVVGLNPVDVFDRTKAEFIAREQVLEIMNFLKTNSTAFKKATLISVAPEIGVRESRKLKGEYVLTAEDLKSYRQFDDVVAYGSYMIDIHSPTGTGTEYFVFDPAKFYSIPYRCLLPKELDNLLVAGRCLSADQAAHSAVRIMPTCACMGEAAGVAAVLAVKNNLKNREVDIKTLRAELKKGGAFISD